MRKLGLSEGESFRRITAARLARRYPVIIAMLESGTIHLTAPCMLRDFLTNANHGELLQAAAKRTKMEVAELIAARFPRADVASTLQELPGLGKSFIEPQEDARSSSVPCAVRSPSMPVVEPLAASRYRLEVTIDGAVKEKLDRAAELLGHRQANDLATIIDRALDVFVAALEKGRFAKTSRAAKRRPAKDGHISQAVRREVAERDGEQCAFVSVTGDRCPARSGLEYDHCVPRALGGSGEVENVRLLCRAHNRRAAERVFGTEYIAERIRRRQRRQVEGVAARGGADVVAAGVDRARVEAVTGAESTFDVAERALRTMGFRASEARDAVHEARARAQTREDERAGATDVPPSEPTLEVLLRSALEILGAARAGRAPRSRDAAVRKRQGP